MANQVNALVQLLREDKRYRFEAYQFVRDALAYAQDVLHLGEEKSAADRDPDEADVERHLSGQQLCQAIRKYALEQYGFLAPVVLRKWGVHATSDFGEIVYNLIRINLMKKSEEDRREDFDDVYDFDEAFRAQFRITPPRPQS